MGAPPPRIWSRSMGEGRSTAGMGGGGIRGEERDQDHVVYRQAPPPSPQSHAPAHKPLPLNQIWCPKPHPFHKPRLHPTSRAHSITSCHASPAPSTSPAHHMQAVPVAPPPSSPAHSTSPAHSIQTIPQAPPVLKPRP